MNESDSVFVYGTLLSGQSRSHVFPEGALVHPEAYIQGMVMLDLGSFPGIMRNDGLQMVKGEVYRLTPDLLRSLDRIEGYNASRPEHSLYVREVVEILTAQGEVIDHSWVYIFNARHTSSSRPVIASGDWRAHIQAKHGRTISC